ncbi:MAG: hypothetical protein RBT41_11860, partial [Clostridia bacterium]|nr:hypothetical protein [Clostridia bacterium]
MITTFRDALKHATARLTAAGWERQTAFLEAALLLCSATGLERIKLLTSLDERLIEEYRHTYEAYLERRLAHEPLQYILGKQTFMSLDFAVTPDVLVPRGETELLVQEAIRFVQDEKWDQGTGPLSRCPAILDL